MNKGKATEPDGAILFVFDEAVKIPVDLPRGVPVVVCPITTDFQLIDSTLESIESLAEGEVTLINYAELFNKKAFSIRDSFIKFMAEFPEKPLFGEKNLKEYFVDRKNKFSLWWLTPIAEKNTVTFDSYRKTVALLTIVDIFHARRCLGLQIDIADRALAVAIKQNVDLFAANVRDRYAGENSKDSRQTLVAFSQLFGSLGKLTIKMITSRWAMRGTSAVQALKNAQYLLVTYFPLIDMRAWKEKRFRNRYFEPIQLELEKKYPGQVASLAIFTRIDSYGWTQALAMGREAAQWGYHISFSEQWLGFRDLLVSAWIALGAAKKFIRFRGIIAREFVFFVDGRHVNIWPLFEKEWTDSFCGRGIIKGLVDYHIFRHIFRQLEPDATVLYIAEMLSWEKALNIAAKESPGVKTVGVQHTAVPLLLLSYAVAPSELRNDDLVGSLPIPDYLACVGRTTSDHFISSGWEEKRVFPWGAIRFSHFRALQDKQFSWSKRTKTVVLALSYSFTESRELLYYVWQALSDQDIRVTVKAHPANPALPIVRSLGLDFAGSGFEIGESPLSDVLPEARAMIVAGSSAGLDGLACGCPVIIPRVTGAIDRNALTGFSELPIYVNSAAELREVIMETVTAESSPISVDACGDFLENYLWLPETDKEFLTSLEAKIGAIK